MDFKKGVEVTKGSSIKSLAHGQLPDTPEDLIDKDLLELKAHQLEWAQEYPMAKRIQLLEETLSNIAKYQDEWIRLDLQARQVPEGHWSGHYSGPIGPYGAMGLISSFIATLKELEVSGNLMNYVKARQEGDRVVINSYPKNEEEAKFLPGVRAELHLIQGTRVEDLPSLQASVYKDESYKGGVSLVLCAGNVSSLTFRDAMHKLINEKKVVMLKSNPVLEYMGQLMEKVLEPFIREGFVRIATGGTKEGHFLVKHPLVDDIIMTGSDKTFENIVYGGGEEGQKNKALDNRVNPRPVSAELGNVSPVIVLPGDWEDKDFEHYADLLLDMMKIMNGYACLATRMLVLPKDWNGSQKLLSMVIDRMAKLQPALNYYPGTKQTVTDAMEIYPDALKFGEWSEDTQPLIFATNLDPNKDEVAFTREFWMMFCGQVFIEGTTTEEYLINAVKFVNDKLWGTLVATIFVDPKSQKELEDNKAFKKAIDDLHYGNVTINIWPVVTAMANSSEGAFPGSTPNNIQSGNCVGRNVLLIDKIEKTVYYAPFRPGG